VSSAPTATKGTTVTATAACPVGTQLLGGGGRATEDAGPVDAMVQLTQSYPSAAAEWTAVGIINPIDLPTGARLTVQAYAICTVAP
jgi:hypothetical protein